MVNLSLIVNGKEVSLIKEGIKLQHNLNEFQKIIDENKGIHIISEKDFKCNISPEAVIYLYDACKLSNMDTITDFKRILQGAFDTKKLYKIEEYEKQLSFSDNIQINIDDMVSVIGHIVDANAIKLIKSVLVISMRNIFSDIAYDKTKYNKIGFAINIKTKDQLYYYYNIYQWKIKFSKRFYWFGNYQLTFKFVGYLVISGLIEHEKNLKNKVQNEFF